MLSDSMIGHTVQIALPIFQTTFLGCIAAFAFDNAPNHSSISLKVEKLNKGPGGAQLTMREGLFTTGLTTDDAVSIKPPNP